MLDTTATRVKRALTFRRLYRCRACAALFEAPLSTVGKPKINEAESSPETRGKKVG